MNKRVLKTLIFLCWGFLIAFALLKTVWAEQFAIAVSNKKIIEIGNFIDQREWLRQIIYFINTLLTYHLYLCSCKNVWHLQTKEYLISLCFVIPSFLLNAFIPAIGMHITYLVMFIIPCIIKAKYRTTIIIFSTHILGQLAISFIRSQPINMLYVNILTQLICTTDAFVWLILYYLYSNLYKEDIIMNLMPPVWGKMGKQIEQEIAKIDKKLAIETNPEKVEKLNAKKAEYEKMLANSTEK